MTEALDPRALVDALFVLVLAAFVGYEMVSKVPTMLHTPLMSGANAVHGVIVVGAIIVTATAESPLQLGLGLVGDHPGHDQRGRRLRGHRPHARDVPRPPGRRWDKKP